MWDFSCAIGWEKYTPFSSDQKQLEGRPMDASKVNQAIRECLDKCLEADDQFGAALKCLRELRRSGDWTHEEVDAIKAGVVTMLQMR